MKKLLILIILCSLYGCGLTKRITKTEKSERTSEKTSVSTKDSSQVISKTAPTKSELEIDIDNLSRMVGDFTQRVASGDGNESVIEKRGGKLYVSNNNAGSAQEKTKVKEKEKETVYNSEFVFSETKKFVSRLPWWIWVAVAIYFRKFIFQILVMFFPGLLAIRFFQVVLGLSPK